LLAHDVLEKDRTYRMTVRSIAVVDGHACGLDRERVVQPRITRDIAQTNRESRDTSWLRAALSIAWPLDARGT
jgi:hypothetical protein